ncbi:MAG: class I adenylate-forming enzyme family protein [Woeseiaceae bacterium]|nr:class I adenylate-forming enzyme family protein [Woeseiaceae bacterium]
MNLADVVRINARNRPQNAAIRHAGQTLDYRDCWRRIEGIAAALHATGIRRGNRVGLALKDHPLHLLAHYAVARIGAVIVPVDHRWTATEKTAAAKAFDLRLALTDGECVNGVDCLTLTHSVADTDNGSLPAMPQDPDLPLLISLSSGTTGRPKGAIVTHGNLYERFVSQWTAIGYDASDCFALVTPLFFGAGRSFGMCMLAAGGSVLLAPPPMKPPQLVAALSDAAVTATFLPPTLLRRLLPLAKGASSPLLAHIRYLLVSGEPLYAGEAADCRQRICPNLVGYYASSEGGGVSVLSTPDFETHADTVGTPTFRTEVEIVDADNRPLPAGQVGRLRYRGPGVATRFVDSNGKQTQSEDGWFYPGDLAERLPSGHLALRGRDGDVIIRGGVNIYPNEIEAALQQHPDVRECAVVAKNDGERGQRVVACVVTAADASELQRFCESRLAPYKIPGEFLLFDDLPKAASGKIDKKALAARVADD